MSLFHHFRCHRASTLCLLLAAIFVEAPIVTRAQDEKPFVQTLDPPLFGFYAKVVNCEGIHIRGSKEVANGPLLSACDRVQRMLEHTDTTRLNLIERGVELHLIPRDQSLTSLPEYLDNRTNMALQKSRESPGIYTACAEESLTSPDDTDACVREFAIAIYRYGFDGTIRSRIQSEFRNAVITGLWKGSHAGASPEDYWAQLSAWYFGGHGSFARSDVQFPSPGPQGLRQYDPNGYALLSLLYGGRERPQRIEAIRAPLVSKFALSQTGGKSAELQIVNNSDKPIRMFLIDSDGVTRSMGELGPFNRTIEPTFLSDVWMIQDQRGVELERFSVQDAVSEVIAAD